MTSVDRGVPRTPSDGVAPAVAFAEGAPVGSPGGAGYPSVPASSGSSYYRGASRAHLELERDKQMFNAYMSGTITRQYFAANASAGSVRLADELRPAFTGLHDEVYGSPVDGERERSGRRGR